MQFNDCLRHWGRARRWLLKLFECDDWGVAASTVAPPTNPFEIIETEPRPDDTDATYINVSALVEGC
jgi:hypothetical protein